jgi:chromosome segregation ATPase|tara:strand:+ start:4176 stop:4643 length:468 start_codon:yes stop_codon:yes gene_type:complete
MAGDSTVQSGAAWPPESTTSRTSTSRRSRRRLTSSRKTTAKSRSKPKTRAKPKTKRTTKRRKKDNYLNAAMSDIGKELRRLTSGKTKLQSRLNKSRRNLLNLKAKEDRLRDKLTKLIAKEGPIHEHQRLLKQSLTTIKNKILKVKKIREEIRDPE